jgi:hypothetical protein
MQNHYRLSIGYLEIYSEAPPSGETTSGPIMSVQVNVTELTTWNTNAIQKPQILLYKNLPV